MNIQLNKVFEIVKNGRKMRWKIVVHPYFNSYAIVRDYPGLKNGPCSKHDEEHLGTGGDTLDEAYQSAFDHS